MNGLLGRVCQLVGVAKVTVSIDISLFLFKCHF